MPPHKGPTFVGGHGMLIKNQTTGMTHSSEKHVGKEGRKISWRAFLITLGLMGASAVALSLNPKSPSKSVEQEHQLSIAEIKSLMREFESQYAPYRPE